MIKSVQQCSGESQCCAQRRMVRHENERGPQAKKNDAHIFDAAVGEQPLQVMF